MKLRVTRADLEESVRGNVCMCAVATRIGREIPEAIYIHVRPDTIRWSDRTKGERYVYDTPEEVREYIRAFDEGRLVSPFSFTLENPQVWPISQRPPGLAARQTNKQPTAKRTGTQARVWGARAPEGVSK